MRRYGIRYRALVLAALLALVAVDAAAQGHRTFYGKAIYYSNQFAGDHMACGPKYQPWKMVAAHRSLPCGARVRVKNRANGEIVTVTIQDRGPYSRGYVIDVSRRAARKLGFIDEGNTRIRGVILHR
jgi:rare lipoprotein A